MTAAQPEALGRKGVGSLEVRWLLPGQLAGAVAGWFGRFPAETKVLEDVYLLDPHKPGLVGEGARGAGAGGEGLLWQSWTAGRPAAGGAWWVAPRRS